jgi:hypothetical protein
MKLKFEEEVQAIINAIAQLPNTAENDHALMAPLTIIGPLDRKLIKSKNDKTYPMKQWAKLRRQVSFLYEIVNMGAIAGKKIADEQGFPSQKEGNRLIESEAAKKESYRFMVLVFKKVANGTALERPEFVRIALNYGVLHLSDYEIQKLIDGNNV